MVSNKRIKISFIGDIMCEKPLLKTARKHGGYNFDPVFEQVKDLFQESDYVVGNLETVCAGKKADFTNHIYSFNTPDSFIETIKNAGIDMVSTANNHCLDRGVEGLKRTIQLLSKHGVESIGTCLSEKERNSFVVKDFGGMRVAFLAYTYGTNYQINKVLLDDEHSCLVDLLQAQNANCIPKNENLFIGSLFRILLKFMSAEKWIVLRTKMRLKKNQPTVDNSKEYISEEYLQQLENDVKRAKEMADYTIMYLHSGGQFNIDPGSFSKYFMNHLFESGIDLVVGTHPHVVQKAFQYDDKRVGFFSIGSFSLSPSSVYLVSESLPEYSLMLNIYLDTSSKGVDKITFSILKAIENDAGQLIVYPTDILYNSFSDKREQDSLLRELTTIYNRLTGKMINCVDIEREYLI